MEELNKTLEKARRYLTKADQTLARIIDQVGVCRWPQRQLRFASLVRAIVGQQISTKAAKSIYDRLRAKVAPRRITADSLVALTHTQLRKVGLSNQKATYVLDLTNKVQNKVVNLSNHSRLDNEAVIDELTQVKGIGRWTVEMYLMFSLRRLDVLPVDDWGIKTAISRLYFDGEAVNKADMLSTGEAWRPYRTVACWYCWRSL